mgnify:CR=1 FL=1
MLTISDIFKGNKEDLDFLIELGKELKTQDGLGTRKPLIFKIQDIQTIARKKELVYVGEFLTKKAAKEHLRKYGYRFNEPKIYIAFGGESEELTKLTEILERLYEMNNREETR